MRGYFGIGIEDAKFVENLGTLWRSAMCFGASFIFTIGNRYTKDPQNTTRTERHVPYLHFKDIKDFQLHLARDAKVIGVELLEEAESLESFKHPQQAIYVLGGEDRSLTWQLQGICDYLVKFNSKYCLNVATAGSIVMYDRSLKGIQ